jgi:hypothetical protein
LKLCSQNKRERRLILTSALVFPTKNKFELQWKNQMLVAILCNAYTSASHRLWPMRLLYAFSEELEKWNRFSTTIGRGTTTPFFFPQSFLLKLYYSIPFPLLRGFEHLGCALGWFTAIQGSFY